MTSPGHEYMLQCTGEDFVDAPVPKDVECAPVFCNVRVDTFDGHRGGVAHSPHLHF